ncbi:hypothetical protein [Halogeometricum luteum]|uniref:Uncharacterized protein n=1 Tax=Halogeometricum luteum TaxID=2950537 RepID=A0ABU2FYM1_9EURY|nr:hypothetical protein [Halogeometricum sp. S3BR5-2]MDS0293624.1 hypothetical protein [Halogeometricum sp. S3BR5-2]
MPPRTLLSGTLRRVTVAVSLLTSALFALLAGVLLSVTVGVPVGTGVAAIAATLAFFPILWMHCYLAGYVAYSPTEFGSVRSVETLPAQVTSCTVCGGGDEGGVCRRYGAVRRRGRSADDRRGGRELVLRGLSRRRERRRRVGVGRGGGPRPRTRAELTAGRR